MTLTEILNAIYDPVAHALRINGSGGGGATRRTYAFETTTATSPVDADEYYVGHLASMYQTQGAGKFAVPKAGTIKEAGMSFRYSAGSSENVVVDLMINNTTTVNLTSTLQFVNGVANVSVISEALSQAVALGDTIEFRLTCPTWATNPTSVYAYAWFSVE